VTKSYLGIILHARYGELLIAMLCTAIVPLYAGMNEPTLSQVGYTNGIF
jgi:hypothetical protein